MPAKKSETKTVEKSRVKAAVKTAAPTKAVAKKTRSRGSSSGYKITTSSTELPQLIGGIPRLTGPEREYLIGLCGVARVKGQKVGEGFEAGMQRVLSHILANADMARRASGNQKILLRHVRWALASPLYK